MNLNTRTQLAAGTNLGNRYIIDDIIGSGGMGTVYRARAIASNRWVAIKSLHPELSHSTSAVDRFHQEARLCATIGHHAICQVIDEGTTPGGMPYLVMPLLEGTSLADLIQNGGRLNIDRLLDILAQTLSALLAAHQKGIVHRDLKPHNIFISKCDDGKDRVTLLDFGISKLITGKVDSHLTASGAVLGTAHYMSPEQAKGARDIGFRADIYALGVIAYEIVTGRLPFTGDSYNEVMFKILTEPLPFPTALNPLVPAALERIILKAMSRELSERYSDAEAMLSEVESLRVGVARSKTTGPTLAFTAERIRDAEATAANAPPIQPRNGKLSPPISPRGLNKPMGTAAMVTTLILAAVGGFWIFWPAEPLPEKMAGSHVVSVRNGVRASLTQLLRVQHRQIPVIPAPQDLSQDGIPQASLATSSGTPALEKPASKEPPIIPKMIKKKNPRPKRRLVTREVVKGPDGTEFLFSAKVDAQ